MRDILALFRSNAQVGEREINDLLRRYNRGARLAKRAFSKKQLVPYYLSVKEHDPATWESWAVDSVLEQRLFRTLRMKPRRTASGVATVTVITKPWTCSSACVYCPNDVRMPKSYLANEPACQRAERNYFDPYLQVNARLRVLEQMGHATDKVELIVLGGTWSDYPASYQLWFMTELFRAVNEYGTAEEKRSVAGRVETYEAAGITAEARKLVQETGELQRQVDEGRMSFNEAIAWHYHEAESWRRVTESQASSWSALEQFQRKNETAAHRIVGLVVETRPDLITAQTLTKLRRFGCTKIQMGIQSLDDKLLARNGRSINQEQIASAFALLRLFGMKIHVHFMANLLGATPSSDREDYRRLVTDKRFLPDEIKLYPCILVKNSELYRFYLQGAWRPYDRDELVALLRDDIAVTPPYVRISRMIRDISAHDIVAGNKAANLRQLVEEGAVAPIREIRHREINRSSVSPEALTMGIISYETTVSQERFLQWVTPRDAIVGYARLSLPRQDVVEALASDSSPLPVCGNEAMIREVHVYGNLAPLHTSAEGADMSGYAQHRGLGKELVERCCALATDAGYSAINVISAVGTRSYYRNLGFRDHGLYQQRRL